MAQAFRHREPFVLISTDARPKFSSVVWWPYWRSPVFVLHPPTEDAVPVGEGL